MKLTITATQAKQHTDAFKEITKKLGKDIKWTYEWCKKIQSTNFMDIVSGKALEDNQKERDKTLEERMADVEPTIGCCLNGNVGRKNHMVELEKVPTKVLDQYRKSFAETIAEEQRIDGLTEEQREAEVQEALKELRKSPGFMSFIRH